MQKKNRFVSPFSRAKEWTQNMSNNFFKRTNNRMSQRMTKEHHLIKVMRSLFFKYNLFVKWYKPTAVRKAMISTLAKNGFSAMQISHVTGHFGDGIFLQ